MKIFNKRNKNNKPKLSFISRLNQIRFNENINDGKILVDHLLEIQ